MNPVGPHVLLLHLQMIVCSRHRERATVTAFDFWFLPPPPRNSPRGLKKYDDNCYWAVFLLGTFTRPQHFIISNGRNRVLLLYHSSPTALHSVSLASIIHQLILLNIALLALSNLLEMSLSSTSNSSTISMENSRNKSGSPADKTANFKPITKTTYLYARWWCS